MTRAPLERSRPYPRDLLRRDGEDLTRINQIGIPNLVAVGTVIARSETRFIREAAAEIADAAGGAQNAIRVVTVERGFTLWGIAENMLGSGFDYVQIFNANRDQIRDPDLIYPGQVFTIPAQ